jgi:DNA-binding FadR family transcriptional regulator
MSTAHEGLQVRLVELFRVMGLGPGDPLPSEPALASRLGVSRQAVRESLHALQALGVVEGRQGARRRLLGFDPSVFGRHVGLTLVPTLESLRELLEIRRILESALLPAAIPLLQQDRLNELRRLTDRMHDLAKVGRTFLDEDEQFHSLLYEQLGNRTLSGLLGAFWQFFKAASPTVTTGHDLPRTAAMHAAIVDALEAGDDDLAAHRMDAHFFDVRDRLLAEQPMDSNADHHTPVRVLLS